MTGILRSAGRKEPNWQEAGNDAANAEPQGLNLMSKQVIRLELNAERRQNLYNALQNALEEHHNGKPKNEMPALVYEGLDALALILAGIWVGLADAVGEEAAKTAKRYLKERTGAYTDYLAGRPKKPIVMQ